MKRTATPAVSLGELQDELTAGVAAVKTSASVANLYAS